MSSVLLDTAGLAERETAPLTVCFSVHADAEPGVMPRVLELFAKRGLVPQKWHSAASGTALTIDVQMAGLGRDTADYMARCMRQIAGVDAVLTSAI
jgi:acetolactate synthase regulatory subunit